MTREEAAPRLTFPLRRRRLAPAGPDTGRRWQRHTRPASVATSEVAVVVCDMWDRHWSTGAMRRGELLAPRIDAFCSRLREAGALIVHAPSETTDAYHDHPARRRVAGTEPIPVPPLPPLPALPVDASEGGSDTDDAWPQHTPVWTRQHPAIGIDPDRDVLTDDGGELGAYLRAGGRGTVLMTGVHTNFCILRRSFGLAALGAMGFQPVLVADLTDAMYDPATPPYVDHDRGTELVVDYVEAFVAPTTTSAEIDIGSPPPA